MLPLNICCAPARGGGRKRRRVAVAAAKDAALAAYSRSGTSGDIEWHVVDLFAGRPQELSRRFWAVAAVSSTFATAARMRASSRSGGVVKGRQSCFKHRCCCCTYTCPELHHLARPGPSLEQGCPLRGTCGSPAGVGSSHVAGRLPLRHGLTGDQVRLSVFDGAPCA